MRDPREPTVLFQRLLGPAWNALPAPLRHFHSQLGNQRWRGRASVALDAGVALALVRRVARLPRQPGDVACEVIVERSTTDETWTRRFGESSFASSMIDRDGALIERLGALTFRFALLVESDAIRWRLRGLRLLFVPIPVGLFELDVSERVVDGKYGFCVDTRLRGVGRIVRYEGWLEPVA